MLYLLLRTGIYAFLPACYIAVASYVYMYIYVGVVCIVLCVMTCEIENVDDVVVCSATCYTLLLLLLVCFSSPSRSLILVGQAW